LKELGVKKVSFTLMADDDDSYKKQTEFIQSALTETFGGKMTVSVNNLPKTTRVSRQIANNFDVVLGGLTRLPRPIPLPGLHAVRTDLQLRQVV
jgi:oligopeptide transport system substrate-binding protein